ncbi:hypothetical protein pb186bvf_018949 [Paramecium bursaria]
MTFSEELILQFRSLVIIQNRLRQIIYYMYGFKFPSHGFLFTILILDSNGSYIENTEDKTYYTIQFQKQIVGQDQTTYNIGQCGQWIKEYFYNQGSQMDLDEIQCIDEQIFSQDSGILLENSLVLKNFIYNELQIFRCQNSTTQNFTCAFDEEIDSKLSNGFVGYSYPQYQFDPLNYSLPFQMKVATRQLTLNIKDQKTINVAQKLSQSLTEQNIFYFFPEQKIENGIEYYETIIDQQVGIVDGQIFGMNFYLDDQKIVYKRTYQNILNIFGSIGGTFSVLKIMFMIILQPIQQLLLTLTMYNKISGKQKPIKIQDYFKSTQKRQIIQEYSQIISKLMELYSYMEIMLKYENDMLTFRLDKLAAQNCDLLKSQTMVNQYYQEKEVDQVKCNIDLQEQIEIFSIHSEADNQQKRNNSDQFNNQINNE